MKRRIALIIAAMAIIIAVLMIDWRAIRVWTYKREMANAWDRVVTLGAKNPNQSDEIARMKKYRDLLTSHGHFKYAEFRVSLTAREYDRVRYRDFTDRIKAVNSAGSVTLSDWQMPYDKRQETTVLSIWAVPELMPKYESVIKQFNADAATTQAGDN